MWSHSELPALSPESEREDKHGISMECEKGGCVTVEIQQASNYLPTGALTPWKRSELY